MLLPLVAGSGTICHLLPSAEWSLGRVMLIYLADTVFLAGLLHRREGRPCFDSRALCHMASQYTQRAALGPVLFPTQGVKAKTVRVGLCCLLGQ